MSDDFSKPPQGNTPTPDKQLEGAAPSLSTKTPEIHQLWGTMATVLMAAILYIVPTVIVIVVLQSLLIGRGYSVDQVTKYFETTTGQFVFMALTAVLSLFVLFILMRITGENKRTIALTRPRVDALVQLGKAVVVYYVLLIITGFIIQEFTPIDTNQQQDIGFTDTSGTQLILVFISLVILPPITEELMFRGFLYSRFRKYFSIIGAAIIISLLFSVAHLQLGNGEAPLWTAAIDTFLLSLILVWLREKTGSIIPGIGLHAIKNGFAFSVLFILS